jgi:hypothetical protein
MGEALSGSLTSSLIYDIRHPLSFMSFKEVERNGVINHGNTVVSSQSWPQWCHGASVCKVGSCQVLQADREQHFDLLSAAATKTDQGVVEGRVCSLTPCRALPS